MFPNFEEIAKIDNEFQRIVLYTATGALRETLEKAFPQCYSTELTTTRVPYSIARSLARRAWSRDGEEGEGLEFLAAIGFGAGLAELGFPEALGLSWWREMGEECPTEIIEQIMNRKVDKPIILEYMGEKFVITYLGLGNEDKRLGVTINSLPNMVTVFPLSIIDLNS